MNFFEIITSNQIINVTIIAWFVAQFLKVLIVFLTEHKLDLERFVGAGGMPSSHSATVCALTVCVARKLGVDSAEFAVCFVFSLIATSREIL